MTQSPFSHKRSDAADIYLDHAATSYPKPAAVEEAVLWALRELAAPGRGTHPRAQKATQWIEEARRAAADLLGAEDPSRVVFTKSATEGINCALKGFVRPGDRVVATSMEHNAVARPLARLMRERDVTVEWLPCLPSGALDLDLVRKALDPPPRLVVCPHASNVNGALFPVESIARLCHERGVAFLLDAAQTAGIVPIHADQWGCAMIACSGHKGLLGPSGVGLLYVGRHVDVAPLLEGGTGSRSEQWEQPEHLPDRYEAGTPNVPGIAGLKAGIHTVQERGVQSIGERERGAASFLEDQMEAVRGVVVHRPHRRGGNAVSFRVEGLHPQDVASVLAQAGIAVRAGLHCAPLAHRTLGTYPEGTVRAAPGLDTSQEDLLCLVERVDRLVSRKRRRGLR
ncbi:cysteine desulfurase family protein [Desulfacinum hydrothermale DSM 13146]|uniref:cysteine desulfurase n=1 Tax=Desulfacinum hydrothermale DSM 13146 TaxID=1121390 RepID=A0A1W1XK62_9BACT|nr:aminotransferase class V-fold PLP-dependent enzyme [Desulfacinum hydrothermale]SMC23941.1 cysteine desulfurase family protein [Desulfacinum hydrothermale DSM 13146]